MDKESTMSEAVEVVADVFARAWEEHPNLAFSDYHALECVRALLEPRVTDCETCQGKRFVTADDDTDVWLNCPAPGCDRGQVTRPSIAVLRGDVAPVTAYEIAGFLCDEGWAGRWDLRDELNMRPQAEITATTLARMGLYRIASGGTDSE